MENHAYVHGTLAEDKKDSETPRPFAYPIAHVSIHMYDIVCIMPIHRSSIGAVAKYLM